MRKVGKRAVVKHVNYQGLDLAIEFQKGGKRPYKDEAGKEHFKTMRADYGEIRGTEGLDGDAVDVYVGPDQDSDKVFVVTQMKRGDWDKVDEEKCILGVRSAKQARDLYLAHYNDDRFCGSIKELTFEQFLKRLSTRGLEGQKLSKLHAIARHAHKLKHVRGIEQSAMKETTMNQVNKRLAAMEEATGEKIASAAGRIAEINYLRMQQGAPVLHGGAHGVKVATPGRLGVEVEPDLIDTFLKNAGSKNDPDPQWDNEIANDVQTMLKKKAPHSLEDKRRSAIAKSELVRHEQIGIGIPEANIRDNPKDSKMRKAAALAHVNLFLKEASAATKKAVEPGVGGAAAQKLAARDSTDHSVGPRLGAALGGVAGLGYNLHRASKGKRTDFGDTLGSYLIGTAGGAALGTGASVAHALRKKHKNRQPATPVQPKAKPAPLSPEEKRQRSKQRLVRGAAALGGAALGAAGGHQALKRFGPKLLQKVNKGKAIKQIEQQMKPHKAIVSARDSREVPDQLTNKSRAAGKIRELDSYKRMVERVPASDFAGKPDRKQTQQAIAAGGLLGASAGAGVGHSATRPKEKKAAMSERASGISDRIDDVGIGILASPYIAEGLSKRLAGKPGRLGRVGAALHAYHENFPKKNRKEIAGLALVAPGLTHTLAKGVDKLMPKKKVASSLFKSALLGAPVAAAVAAPAGRLLRGARKVLNFSSPAAATVPAAAKAVVPAAAQAAAPAVADAAAAASPGLLRRGAKAVGGGIGTGLMLGGAGVGAGIYGAKKLLTGHRTEGLSAPSYQPPRMF